MNIYGEDDDDSDANSIIIAKNWLTKPKKPKPTPENPVQISLEQLPEPLTLNPLVREPHPKYLTKISQLEQKLNQIQAKKDEKIKKLPHEKEALETYLENLNEQNTTLQQAKVQAITEKEQAQQDL